MNYTGKSFVSAVLVAALAIAVASCSGVERAYVQIDADRAEIVVPAGASPVVSFAAEEMSGVLKVGGKGEFGWNRNFKGRFVDVMPGDWMKKCLCENCEKTYVKDSKQWATELVWGNTARLAQRLMDDGIDCIVTQMAYPPHRDVPQCSLPSNVWVMVAETGPWAEACPGEPEREMDEVRRWTEKLGHKIWMWTYPSKYGEKATPGVRIWRNIYTPAVLKQQVGHLMGFVLSRAVGEAWMDCMALEELGQAVGGK